MLSIIRSCRLYRGAVPLSARPPQPSARFQLLINKTTRVARSCQRSSSSDREKWTSFSSRGVCVPQAPRYCLNLTGERASEPHARGARKETLSWRRALQ